MEISQEIHPDGSMTWRFSAAWLARRHDCTPAGIAARCGGKCCATGGPGAFPPRLPSGSCPYLGPKGCTFTPADKPVACLFYPLLIQGRPKTGIPLVVLHHITTMRNSDCSGNHGEGPPVVAALAEHLTELMGVEAYNELKDSVYRGDDYRWTVPAQIVSDWLLEREDMDAERVPPPRSQRPSV